MSANTDALALKGGALGPDGLEEGEEPATGRCDGHTTALNFRSLPRRFSAQDLAAEVELYMPRTTFDLVYVPWSRRKNNHVGAPRHRKRARAFPTTVFDWGGQLSGSSAAGCSGKRGGVSPRIWPESAL